MGLFGAIGAAIGGKSKNSSQQDVSKPFHVHSSDDKDSSLAGAGMGPKGGDSRFDLGDRNDSFMGKNENISGIEFSDVTRGGRAIDPMVENNPVQTAGNFSPLGTPDFVPREDSEEYGKQFIS
jgi:hypothetical protein